MQVKNSETTIVNVKADLGAGTYGPDLVLTNNCSNPQLHFLNNIIDSTRSIKRVVNRLVSMQGQTNLIECDSYLRRFYRYATGLTSTMICPRAYQSSLKECKSWASLFGNFAPLAYVAKKPFEALFLVLPCRCFWSFSCYL